MISDRNADVANFDLVGLKGGNHKAWSQFLRSRSHVFRLALARAWSKRTGSVASTSELEALETEALSYFYEIFGKSFSEYQGEDRLRLFVFRVMDYFVLEKIKAERGSRVSNRDLVNSAFEPMSVEITPSQHLGNEEVMGALHDCVLHLPPHMRRVVNLYHFGETRRTLKVIAELLGETYMAVHKRYRRALGLLADCLKKLQPTLEA